MVAAIGKGFTLFRKFVSANSARTCKIATQTVDDTVYTVVKNLDDNIILQRAKTIKRNPDGISVKKVITKVDSKDNLLQGLPVKYNDLAYYRSKNFNTGKVSEIWETGRQPLNLNPKNLAHKPDLVQTGHLTRYPDGTLTGVPNGFEYII